MIFDPAQADIDAVASEPALPESRLVPDWLRHRFAQPVSWTPEFVAEPALLTQRTDHLRDHAGQISFPGGGLKPGETPLEAALREAEEEIGLERAAVDVFGEMPRYHTGTGFNVSPMIAFVSDGVSFRPDPGEVAEIFDVPLDYLIDPRNFREETRFYRGAWRSFLAIPWSGRYIWPALCTVAQHALNRISCKRLQNLHLNYVILQQIALAGTSVVPVSA